VAERRAAELDGALGKAQHRRQQAERRAAELEEQRGAAEGKVRAEIHRL
jgi:hypothetical protein